MKDIGKVKEYNDYYGVIINEKGDKYLLLDKEVVEGDKIKESDLVSFVPEYFEKNDVKQKVARFVKKIDLKKKP